MSRTKKTLQELTIRDNFMFGVVMTMGDNCRRFLEFVRADLAGSVQDFGDEYVRSLQDSVAQVKESREMGERYMIFEEMLRDERIETARDYILDNLEDLGTVPETARKVIDAVTDMELLKLLHKKAARAKSMEQFVQEAEEILAESQKRKEAGRTRLSGS